jgi:hypothetical protein
MYRNALAHSEKGYKTDFWSHVVFPNGFTAVLCFDGVVKIFTAVELPDWKVKVVTDERIKQGDRFEEFESLRVILSTILDKKDGFKTYFVAYSSYWRPTYYDHVTAYIRFFSVVFDETEKWNPKLISVSPVTRVDVMQLRVDKIKCFCLVEERDLFDEESILRFVGLTYEDRS